MSAQLEDPPESLKTYWPIFNRFINKVSFVPSINVNDHLFQVSLKKLNSYVFGFSWFPSTSERLQNTKYSIPQGRWKSIFIRLIVNGFHRRNFKILNSRDEKWWQIRTKSTITENVVRTKVFNNSFFTPRNSYTNKIKSFSFW